MDIKTVSLGLGDCFGSEVSFMAFNRTGAAVVEGDMGAINLDFVDTTYNEINPVASSAQNDNYVFGNVVAVTTENRNRVMCVAAGPIAASAIGKWILRGIINVEQNGANPGEFLTGTDAQTYATPLMLTEILALTTQVGIVGICLEASTGVQAKKALFDGFAFKSLCGGDT